MTDDTLPHYQWLASPDGAAALAAAADLRARGIADLRVGEILRATHHPAHAALVLTQLDLRRKAAAKFHYPERLLFTRAGLEQATNEDIANYHAARFGGQERITDLCCGIGGDLMALATQKAALTAVDLDPVHLLLAAHNVHQTLPGADLTAIRADVREVTISPRDAVFIDPARRSSTGKRYGYQSEPPLAWAIALAERSAAVGIKTAPGVPHDLVPDTWELELIALGHEVKEAVLWSPSLATTARRATVLNDGVTHTLTSLPGEEVPVGAVSPGDWLLDVNPAVTNAGLVQDLARRIGAWRIDTEIGFLVTSHDVESPFVQHYRVTDVLPWHEKRLRQALAAHDIGPIDIRRRGLPGDVDAITRRLRGNGSRRAMIAMTRVAGAPTAIICELAES